MYFYKNKEIYYINVNFIKCEQFKQCNNSNHREIIFTYININIIIKIFKSIQFHILCMCVCMPQKIIYNKKNHFLKNLFN